MITKGKCFVRALNNESKWASVDILDLDDESFRRFTITKLLELGAVVVVELGKEEEPLHEKEKS